MTNKSAESIKTPIKVGDTITLEVAKSYDGSYAKGHYGLDNYRGIITDSVRVVSLTPDIATSSGLTLTAEKAGTAQFEVQTFQYGDSKLITAKTKVYSVKIIVSDVDEPEPTEIEEGLIDGKYDKGDYNALIEIIRQQNALGANMSENLDRELKEGSGINGFTWNSDGRLVAFDYPNANLQGELDLTPFTELKEVNVSKNQLTKLNVENLIHLKQIQATRNQLTEIKMKSNTSLNNIECSNNQLKELDLSGAVSLKKIFCAASQLESLNITNLSELELCHCPANNLTELDLAGLLKLSFLACFDNKLTELDITGTAIPDNSLNGYGVIVTRDGKQLN